MHDDLDNAKSSPGCVLQLEELQISRIEKCGNLGIIRADKGLGKAHSPLVVGVKGKMRAGARRTCTSAGSGSLSGRLVALRDCVLDRAS